METTPKENKMGLKDFGKNFMACWWCHRRTIFSIINDFGFKFLINKTRAAIWPFWNSLSDKKWFNLFQISHNIQHLLKFYNLFDTIRQIFWENLAFFLIANMAIFEIAYDQIWPFLLSGNPAWDWERRIYS